MGVTLHEDVVRKEANHDNNKWLWARRQRSWAWSTARAATRERGEESPFEAKPSQGGDKEEDEDEEMGEVTPPTHSPPPEDLPLPGDLLR
jgi:hypothetical protein